MNGRSIFGCVLSCALVPACGAQVLDVGSNASAPSVDDSWFPTSACVAVGATPKIVTRPGIGFHVKKLVADGKTLWFDGYDTSAQSSRMQVGSAPVAGGPPAFLAIDDFTGLAGVSAGRLVYLHVSHWGDGSLADPMFQEIVIRDPVSSASTSLPNRRPASGVAVSGVTVHASGIYWLNHPASYTDPISIARFSESATAELRTLDAITTTVTDGQELHYFTWENDAGSAFQRFEAVPVAGGAPRLVRRFATDDKNVIYNHVAIDDAEVYFVEEHAIDRDQYTATVDLHAMGKDGRGDRLVASRQAMSLGTARMDPDFVMWIDAAKRTIFRVPRAGGDVERVEGVDDREVTALAVDRCNVYWAVQNPPAIFARSRLP